MTPKRLRLRNFLCYGEEFRELDFEQLHVACIVGRNGAGKSSLLEAIAWCIWGETPRGANRDIIRIGANEAQVELEFELDEKLYKISRIAKRSKDSSATQSVDFFCWDADNNRFRPLNGNGVRETDARILREIGISYDTFINSVFLLQGRSNEFTVQRPNKRKEILAEILQLERYSQLSERSKDKTRALREEQTQLRAQITLLENELANEVVLRQRHNTAVSALSELKYQKEKCEAELAEQERKLELLQEKKIALQAEELRLRDIERQIRECEEKIKKQEHDIHLLHERLAQREQIERNMEKYTKFKAELQVLDSLAAKYRHLKDTLIHVQNEIMLARQRLEQNLETERHHISSLKKDEEQLLRNQQRKIKAQQELEALSKAHETRRHAVEELQLLRHQQRELSGKHGQLNAQIENCKAQMNQIEKKAKEFKALKDAVCPVCHSALTAEHREKVLAEYRQEYSTFRDESRRLSQQLEQLKVEMQNVETCIHEKEKLEKELRQIEKDLARARSTLEELEQVEKELERVRLDLANLERAAKALSEQLQSENFAHELKVQQASLKNEINALAYDEHAHAVLREQVNQLSDAPVEYERIKVAEENLQKYSREVRQQKERLHQLLGERTSAEQIRAELAGQVEMLKEAEVQKANLKRKWDELSSQWTEKASEVQFLEKRLNDLEQKRQNLHQAKNEEKRVAEEIELYEILAEAFSVRGIQSLLIEESVPEIEREANRILQNLTNNYLALRIETQRHQQNEKVVESLDIYISDVNGVSRDYDTFSGGERFRIDFALRVALSKLLAKQRNFGLKMLVIDEGFGSQDKEGLDAMMEAIEAVKDDFEKILIITHLDKLHEQFETKIFVQRDATTGACFEVVCN
jgi:exonuclease SbcC